MQPAQPQQPQQVQPVQTVPQQQVQQQPIGTTQTTAAPYVPPGGERRETHLPNRSLLSTGAGVFLLSYAPSVVIGAMSPRDADKKLFIPVAGPWMDLGHRGCGPEHPCGKGEDIATAMLITSGVVQGAGVLMALGSLVIPESTTITEKTATGDEARGEGRAGLVPRGRRDRCVRSLLIRDLVSLVLASGGCGREQIERRPAGRSAGRLSLSTAEGGRRRSGHRGSLTPTSVSRARRAPGPRGR